MFTILALSVDQSEQNGKEVLFTHSQRDAASSHDLSVGLPDAPAGVLQIKQIHIYVPNVSNQHGLIRCCLGAAVVSPQHGRLDSDLSWTKPVEFDERQ